MPMDRVQVYVIVILKNIQGPVADYEPYILVIF